MERGRAQLGPLGNAAGTTTTTARDLSASILKDAIAHINKHLGDAEWIRANRQIHQGAAVWELQGNSLLTVPERGELEAAYKGEDWEQVSVAFHSQNESNWKITFQLK